MKGNTNIGHSLLGWPKTANPRGLTPRCKVCFKPGSALVTSLLAGLYVLSGQIYDAELILAVTSGGFETQCRVLVASGVEL